MTLYHRSSSRLPLSIDVNVFHMGKNLARTHTRNINPFGAFIELPTVKLAINDFVELHFIDQEHHQEYLVQKGLVMHRAADGVGVLFAYDSAEFRKMLRHKIAGKRPPEEDVYSRMGSFKADQHQSMGK
jgi:hypothetical protein